MKLMFHDQTFSFELLRAIGYSIYDGADIGECLASASRITESDFESWYTEWTRTAERIHHTASDCLTQGHQVSARSGYAAEGLAIAWSALLIWAGTGSQRSHLHLPWQDTQTPKTAGHRS